MNKNSAATGPDVSAPPPRVDSESLARGAMDEVALIIGGAAELHQLDDDFVWTVMRRLDRVRVRLLRDIKGLTSSGQLAPTPEQPPHMHAAVEEFLVRNRSGMGE